MNKAYAPLGELHAFDSKDARPKIPCRQYCAICGNLYAVDYHISHQEIWDEAIHPHYRNSTVCLECFIRRADEKDLQWDLYIKFYPCSAYEMNLVRRRAEIDAARRKGEKPK